MLPPTLTNRVHTDDIEVFEADLLGGVAGGGGEGGGCGATSGTCCSAASLGLPLGNYSSGVCPALPACAAPLSAGLVHPLIPVTPCDLYRHWASGSMPMSVVGRCCGSVIQGIQICRAVLMV